MRSAIIGTGFMGRVHLETLQRLGTVEAHTVSARNQADYRRVLEDRSIAAVHICTPNTLHFPMARAALEAGKHVLCEKPLATSSDDARQLVALAGAKGLRNCTCHNLRYYPMVQHMRRMREDGDLGEVLVYRALTRRTGCCMTRIGTGGSIPATTALRVCWPTSARTGATWSST